MPRIETERLLLRPLTEKDFGEFAAMMADPRVTRFLGAPPAPPMSAADAWRALAVIIGHGVMRGYTNWAVVEKESGLLVGRAGPWWPHEWPGLEVGWCLAPRFWGRGYATEAGRAALAYCFDQLNATDVISVIHPDNAASIAVAERIGHRYLRMEKVRGVQCAIYGQHRPGP